MNVMNNVLHAIWKSDVFKDHQVSGSFDLFYERIPTWPSGLSKIVDSSVDNILQQAAYHETVDWIVVHGEGQIYRSQNRILELTQNFIQTLDPNILVAGQLINKPGQYCGIHEQFLIINLNTYRRLGKPAFGGYEDKQMRLHNYVAGPSFHDDYTPRYLEPGQGESEYRTWTCGWNFVHVSMANGLKIPNIPEDIRREKIYLYPNDNSATLLKNLDALYNIMPTDNISQNRVLAYMVMKKLGLDDTPEPNNIAAYRRRKGGVFVFNTEILVPEPEWIRDNGGPLSCFIGTCAGFLDICNLKHFGFDESTKLVYYDINPDAVTFKKHLLDNFEGDLNQLPQFIADFKAANPHILIADNSEATGLADLRREFPNDDEFHSLWNRMRRLERQFTTLNLFGDYKKVFRKVVDKDKRAMICISDIFTGTNELTYGVGTLRSIFHAMMEDFSNYPKLVVQGKDYRDHLLIGYAPDLHKRYSRVQ